MIFPPDKNQYNISMLESKDSLTGMGNSVKLWRMDFTITKEFSFDAAHRLVNGYEGKCSNIHGHTWKCRITVGSPELNLFGFVRDYGDLKILKSWIDNQLDHAMIVSKDDLGMIDFLVNNNQKHYILPVNPTSEHLARTLYGIAEDLNFKVLWVEIDETCTSSARYAPHK